MTNTSLNGVSIQGYNTAVVTDNEVSNVSSSGLDIEGVTNARVERNSLSNVDVIGARVIGATPRSCDNTLDAVGRRDSLPVSRRLTLADTELTEISTGGFGAEAITATGITNATVSGNVVTDVAPGGVELLVSNEATVQDNALTDIGVSDDGNDPALSIVVDGNADSTVRNNTGQNVTGGIRVVDGSETSILDNAFDMRGNIGGETAPGVDVSNVTTADIDNVSIDIVESDIGDGVAASESDDVTITDVVVNGPGSDGIVARGQGNLTVNDTRVTNASDRAVTLFGLGGELTVNISGNEFGSSRFGIRTGSLISGAITENTIENNEFGIVMLRRVHSMVRSPGTLSRTTPARAS
ncbi:MAG: hypothetical protein J07HX64_02890 [halophilic archaeon J07HX64]|nr:MAG: hypothetical protein J07HX64_02890 [halophilic archaeon J07HX64]